MPKILLGLIKQFERGGPLYARYQGESQGHIVIVTGGDLSQGRVFTNNPDGGIQGAQLFEDFLKEPAGGTESNMPFEACYLIIN